MERAGGSALPGLAVAAGRLAWFDDGCGDGSFTESLVLHQCPATVVGVDPAPAQLSHARQRVSHASVRFLQGDAQALLPDASVDAAVMALVLFFVPDLAGVRDGAGQGWRTVAAINGTWTRRPLQPIRRGCTPRVMSQPPPSAWAAATKASCDLWRGADLVDVQTRQFGVSRTF